MSMPMARPSGVLPPQQQRVMDFIHGEIAEGRAFPSDDAIANHMGWKNGASARDCLYRLKWRGVVKFVGQGVWELVET